MKDFEADEMFGIEHIRTAFFKACDLFGYAIVEPSTIEMLSVLEAKSGPAIRDEVYYFEDKGGRLVSLRFDLTVGMTRYAAAQKSMRLPSRRASFNGVWRYDEPQKGRYRYFHQWDIEVYGANGIEADAETIEFTACVLEFVGLRNTIIEISHRAIAESYITNIIKKDGALGDMLRAVDKTLKRPESVIISEYESKGYSRKTLEDVMRLSQAKGTLDEVKAILGETSPKGWTELQSVLDSLKSRGVNNVLVNLGIVRGLDYYSGIVFEAFAPDFDAGALAGGGRYDSLAESIGFPPLSAVGAAGGVERTLLAMNAQNVTIPKPPRRVVVAFAQSDMHSRAVSLSSELRKIGIAANTSLAGHNLKKQISNALQDNIRAIIIVAPREIQNDTVVVKNMDARTEKTIKINELLSDPESTLS